MTQVNAHMFEDVYTDLGVNLDTLGCIMLDVEPINTDFIDQADLYYTNNKDRFWIKGNEGQKHVTLLYGLLPEVRRCHVDRILDGLPVPAAVYLSMPIKFESPYPDEDYECIVAPVILDEVAPLNNRLSMLPHVKTFEDYRPHVTIAYVRKGWYAEHVSELSHLPQQVWTKGLNYGRMLS